jgi:predicted transcriptional regulator
MSTVKERVSEIVQAQPDDSSFDEILRELAFSRMVEHGLADSRQGRMISNEEMEYRIRTWQK